MGPWFVRTGARKQSSSPDMGVAHAVAVVVTLLGVCEVRAIPRGHLRKPQTSQPWQQEGSPLSRVPVTTPPAPPRQTPFQHSLLSRVDVEAAEAAKAAIPVLLERLEESSFRTALGRCCPSIANAPAPELLGLLTSALRSAELTHNFNANSSHAWEGDVNATTAPSLNWYPNLWEVQWLGLVSSTDQSIEDVAEVNLMGFRPFTGGSSGHPAPAARSEASERPTYTTVSMLRLATGNPTFGDVSVVFRPTYAQPLALLDPLDTGNWEEVCNRSSPPKPPIGCATFPYAVNCSAWTPRVQGTFAHPEHIILANVEMWNGGKCVNETGGMLPRLFALLFGKHQQDRALTHPAQIMTFVEANLAGTVLYPDGVKLIVAAAQTLFGTLIADQIRAWCTRWGWALLWTLAPPDDDSSWWTNGSAVMDTRVLDPTVPTTLNLTVSRAAVLSFNATWNRMRDARAGGQTDKIQWSTHVWPELPAELIISAGLWPGHCANVDACVGTTSTNDCVCYSAHN